MKKTLLILTLLSLIALNIGILYQFASGDIVTRSHLREVLSERFAYLEGEMQQALGGPTLPAAIANFETSLASSISTTDTTMTLVSFTDKEGQDLIEGTLYGFTIDEGTTNEEHVMGTATTSNQVEDLIRGVSVSLGTTSVSSLKKAHSRGASVKMTDAPLLILMARILRGEEQVAFDPTLDGHLVDKEYADSLSFGSVPAATEVDDGFVELSTQIEMASSTQYGLTGSSLVLQAQYATSNPLIAGHYIPITEDTGLLSENFLPKALSGAYTHTGSITINDIPLGGSSYITSTTTQGTGSGSSGSWSYASTTIPANTMTTGGIRIKGYISNYSANDTDTGSWSTKLYLTIGTTTCTIAPVGSDQGDIGDANGNFEFVIYATSTTNQFIEGHMLVTDENGFSSEVIPERWLVQDWCTAYSEFDTTEEQTFKIGGLLNSSNDALTIERFFVTKL